ncbi:DPP IV N-terminal domain-containing protein [Mucilaginibacter roseus]|uniref:DPP IV N-terminal domain-containing protein n=1 Tax=Mucilaginibacter roseus TaxID=1528868 RepID=A0ABS8U6B0_9SPHI|nr:S9 family peptidase [Mucilaginibacter roseus]MCD8741389.1 DPP IV N-terminal domain-containing protein [Mucilaginibacter roseus]
MKSKFYSLPVMLMAFLLSVTWQGAQAQFGSGTNWAKDGYRYYKTFEGGVAEFDVRDANKKTVIATAQDLTPAGQKPISIRRFTITDDGKKILINTNTKKVWRYDTRGDYWVYDVAAKSLKQLGKGKPESSLMFAKLSPDASKVAYVSGHNVYVEDLATNAIKALTTDGTDRLINGTFDWVYEEEFGCRDGFRWSPDSKSIAYWQIDARKIKNYLMLNTTDSMVYSYVVPVEYPTAGQDPSSCKIGVVDIATAQTKWLNIPGDNVQHYIPRMEYTSNPDEIILQQLNRAQNESKLYVAKVSSNTAKVIYNETDKAWIDAKEEATGWDWLNKGKEFVWASEKDGWNHLYRIGLDGKQQLITKGNYDVMSVSLIDEPSGYIYFIASPDNPNQAYLYRIKINGGKAERLTPANQSGTHGYTISPNGTMAMHNFSNANTPYQSETISLPDHKHLTGDAIKPVTDAKNPVEFFTVKTSDGIDIKGWVKKPDNFDPAKKYPVVFYVYGEPASQTAKDVYGAGRNGMYPGMAADGYVYISMDNRGAPAPRGREWRKAIYKNIGILNIRDQALAAKEILKWNYIDSSRVAVWGWSGGGSSTLNLMFQYPDIYKTGIAVAAVGYQLTYDNIYQERYMGVPTDDAGREPFIKGSPVTNAKNLQGNLLYIHGTGDDNVHYNNAELLINELVKYNKQFQLMSYPNRTHSISEGAGTSQHLRSLFTKYLKEHCPPGGR